MNQIVIVTGCTSGIGVETTRRLLAAGAHVIMACRSPFKAEALLEIWGEELAGRAKVRGASWGGPSVRIHSKE
jgi:NAD(P)-dependent dehydrogenase (short-subunit alcohol dehydrogenase family)